jgi:hypothetical protein
MILASAQLNPRQGDIAANLIDHYDIQISIAICAGTGCPKAHPELPLIITARPDIKKRGLSRKSFGTQITQIL